MSPSEPASTLHSPASPKHPPQIAGLTLKNHHHHTSTSSFDSPTTRAGATSRPNSLLFSFRRPFQPNASSTTLVPSTAEGRPIPVDNSTAEHRTSALRELNNHFPRRHRYAKSTGAESSTYSEPVIVRSYYSPGPGRPRSTARGDGVIIHQGPPATVVDDRGPKAVVRRMLPFATPAPSARHGILSSMTGSRSKRFGAGAVGSQDAKLPPMEAFTFKSFIAKMEAEGDASDINADLDRIAEICAKSRYSLSNQYEVHYTPHGSGNSFLAAAPRHSEAQGPTLQIVPAGEDEQRTLRRQRRRPVGPRRNSRAMGTLETIMSSSRSSDEDKPKNKSAADIADEVRGRAARKVSGQSTTTTSGSSARSTSDRKPLVADSASDKTSTGRRRASLALIEGPKHFSAQHTASSPQNCATTLTSQLSLPQASTSQLEIRTTPEEVSAPPLQQRRPRSIHGEPIAGTHTARVTQYFPPGPQQTPAIDGIFSTINSWFPWKSPDDPEHTKGRAEGSLRDLLKSADVKAKGASNNSRA